MKNPQLYHVSKEKKTVSIFGGYNNNFRIQENEFSDMENMSSRHYPVLSSRKKRGFTTLPSSAEAMAICSVHNANKGDVVDVHDNVFAIVHKNDDETLLTVTDGTTDFRSETIPTAENTKLVVHAGKLYMFPQKKKLDLFVSGGGTGITSLENEISVTVSGIDAHINFYPCNTKGQQESTGNYIGVIVTDRGSGSGTTFTQNGSPQTTAGSAAMFGIDQGFKAGDCITISGAGELDGSYIIEAVDIFSTGQVGEFGRGLVLNGHIDKTVQLTGATCTFSRKVPDMDYVVEYNNRLFGCRYGVNENNEVINEIYISALGDAANWYRYQGVSTDSETLTVGEEGPFTGAVVYDETPIFFKENCIIRIYGDYPPYTVKTYKYRGVQKGSEKSLCICDEILYYHSYDGILAFNGSAPAKVDSDLGDRHFKNAVAGVIGKRYYISLVDENEAHHLFVFDSQYGIWHREDSLSVRQFCRRNNELYFIDSSGSILKTEGDSEGEVKWFAETGVIGYDDSNEKILCGIQARIFLPIGSLMTFEIEYNEDGVWHLLGNLDGDGVTPIIKRFIPQRCDRYRLKISGTGEGRIISLSHILERGSDTVVNGGRL